MNTCQGCCAPGSVLGDGSAATKVTSVAFASFHGVNIPTVVNSKLHRHVPECGVGKRYTRELSQTSASTEALLADNQPASREPSWRQRNQELKLLLPCLGSCLSLSLPLFSTSFP